MGIFGNAADVIIDVNLIIQWIVFVILVLGYIKRRELVTHGRLMVVATIVNLITVLLVMGPSLIVNLGVFPITIIGHSAIGTLAVIFGLLFSFRFLMETRRGEPLKCGSRQMMRIAFVLWIVPVFFGTFFYVTFYILGL